MLNMLSEPCFGGGTQARHLSQQVPECPRCSRLAAAPQTYECVLVCGNICRQPPAIKLGRSGRLVLLTALWSCHTGLSLSNTWLQYISLFFIHPLEGNIGSFSFFQMGVELTVNRPAFVSSGTTYIGFGFFFLQSKRAKRHFFPELF